MSPPLPAVGVIGCGHMGAAIAARLAACFDLRVHDIRPAATTALAGLGAAVCDTPASLAACCDTVVLSLPSHTEAGQVCGPGGVLAALPRGGVLINATTGSAAAAGTLAAAAASRGLHCVTAPVSQGVRAAGRGELTAFTAGTPQALRLARPVLSAYCGRTVALASHEAAMAAKLLSNYAWAAMTAALPELLATAVRAGIGRGQLRDILTASCGDSWTARNDLPSITDRGDYDPSFTLGLVLKDLALAGELVGDAGVPAGLLPAVAAVFGRACAAYGPDGPELAPVLLLEQQLGVQIGPRPPQAAALTSG